MSTHCTRMTASPRKCYGHWNGLVSLRRASRQIGSKAGASNSEVSYRLIRVVGTCLKDTPMAGAKHSKLRGNCVALRATGKFHVAGALFGPPHLAMQSFMQTESAFAVLPRID